MDPRVIRVKQFFESLTPADVTRLAEIYAPQAYFKDPFNEVRGTVAIGDIFAHMFVQVDSPRFLVRDVVVQGDDAFLTWDFVFRFRRGGAEQLIRGASHLKFDADGRVGYHRDYWDAAEELYEKLPLLGGLMRLLKRQAAR
jgi:hypothetical protein